jgi:hypothetical protein
VTGTMRFDSWPSWLVFGKRGVEHRQCLALS